MAELTINGKTIVSKGSFFFSKRADERYKNVDEEDGKKLETPGIESIYLGLLQRDTYSLVKFWDCACANYPQENINIEDIESALSEEIEKQKDTIKLLREALSCLEDSGFFKQQIRVFWNNFVMMTKRGSEEEQKKRLDQYEMMKEMRDNLIQDEKQEV